MQQYLDLLRDIKTNGVDRGDRTGTGTRSVFGRQMRFDISKSFPLLTTKRVYWAGVAYELLWLLHGDTNVKYLQEHKVHIWDEWADENGELGPIYGRQWRAWPRVGGGCVDQIAQVVESLKSNPYSRRHMVVAWNPDQVSYMALPPCHCLFQFYVANGKLSCQLYQRSCDVFLGLPFNIASYSLLTYMLAATCGFKPGEFVWTGGDVHLYHNHFEQADIQLSRTPKPLPHLFIDPKTNIDDYDFDDFKLLGYNPSPAIKAPIAV